MEMVANGDFSRPVIFQPWSIVGSIPGGNQGVWTTIPPNNGFDLWKQGTLQSPPTDSLGSPTGQHLQINGNSPWAAINYEFIVPCLLACNKAIFAFEYWFQPNQVINNFGFTIEQQGQVIIKKTFSKEDTTQWIYYSADLELKACQPLKISITSDAKSNQGGVHIDNVSLKLAVCNNIQMVSDGNFEQPKISNPWQTVAALPGGTGIWSPSPGTEGFVLWKQGAMGSPVKDSKGAPTGQHLEVNGLSPKAQVSYQFFVPFLLGVAESNITFQYWLGPGGNIINYFGFSVEQNEQIILQKTLSQVQNWTGVNYMLDLQPGVPAQIYFMCNGNGIGGVHIDDVSISITERRDTIQSEYSLPIFK
eukprot:TRINITY_DN290_c0_g1_i4.p1 TRINITY_DN290_c0_g1~~TRINITY_DN290_c0_g1_i4.p1  ORF type:complete len:413 (-),score=28.86 TRINITY_DN290_c0_g1_i4:579-1664(-)